VPVVWILGTGVARAPTGRATLETVPRAGDWAFSGVQGAGLDDLVSRTSTVVLRTPQPGSFDIFTIRCTAMHLGQ